MSAEVRAEITRLASSAKEAHRLVVRAGIVLHASEGKADAEVAGLMRVSARTVGEWRRRFSADSRVDALKDAKRSGRPPQVALATRLEVVKLACNRPDGDKTPFRDVWTQQSLADALLSETGVSLSRSEVRRILHSEGLRPHRVRQWLHSPDPDFAEKVARICDLYLSPPPGAVVLCVDEKPMQALARKHPTRIGPRAVVRREFEYERHGTCALLGGLDVASGDVIGEVVQHRDADALVAYMHGVAACYPDCEVHVVWDNLNIHYDGKDARWTEFNRAHDGRFRFVYTPLHASWVNQVEVWFSILERRVLRHGSFADVPHLADVVLGFIRHWNAVESHPFRWTFRGRFEQTRLVRAA
jgi:transposase